MGDASSAVRIEGTAPGGNGFSPTNIAMLDAVDLPIVVISRECKIVHVNRSATTVLGLTSSDIGRSPGHILPRNRKPGTTLRAGFSGGNTKRCEVRVGGRFFLLQDCALRRE